MKIKILFIYILVVLFVLPVQALERKEVVIGSGNIAGDFYPIAGAICRSINQDRIKHGMRCLVDSTEGSVYNLSALRAKDVDFALAQSNWAYHAYKGTERFKTVGPNEKLRQVLTFATKPLTILVPRNSPVKRLDHLIGRRLYMGPTQESVEELLNVLFRAKNWQESDIKIVKDLETADFSTALCSGEVDAIAFALTHPNGIIQHIANLCDVQALPIDMDAIAELVKDEPALLNLTLSANQYIGLETEGIPTFGFAISLYTLSDLDQKYVYQAIRSVKENLKSFKQWHPVLHDFKMPERSTPQVQVPFHKGASSFIDKNQ